MLKVRLDAAHKLRDAYVPLKTATATLSADANRCCATLAEARLMVGKAGFGAKPQARLAKAASLIAEAEVELAAAHPELAQLIVDAGLSRHYVYGIGPDYTPAPGTQRPALGVAA